MKNSSISFDNLKKEFHQKYPDIPVLDETFIKEAIEFITKIHPKYAQEDGLKQVPRLIDICFVILNAYFLYFQVNKEGEEITYDA